MNNVSNNSDQELSPSIVSKPYNVPVDKDGNEASRCFDYKGSCYEYDADSKHYFRIHANRAAEFITRDMFRKIEISYIKHNRPIGVITNPVRACEDYPDLLELDEEEFKVQPVKHVKSTALMNDISSIIDKLVRCNTYSELTSTLLTEYEKIHETQHEIEVDSNNKFMMSL